MEEKLEWIDYLLHSILWWFIIATMTVITLGLWDWKIPPPPLMLWAAGIGFVMGLAYIPFRIRTWDIYTWEAKETSADTVMYAPIFSRLLYVGGGIGMSLASITTMIFGQQIAFAIATVVGFAFITISFWHFIEIVLYIAFHHLS